MEGRLELPKKTTTRDEKFYLIPQVKGQINQTAPTKFSFTGAEALEFFSAMISSCSA